MTNCRRLGSAVDVVVSHQSVISPTTNIVAVTACRINVSRRYARITAYCRRREPSPSQHAIIADYTHDVAVHDRTFAPPGYLPHQTPVPSHENYDLEHLHPG